ncbi:PaaI family thioesterase [Lachnospiraceae bacterium 62-35]
MMDYEKLRNHRNKINAFANMLGLSITEIGDGYARSEMPVSSRHLNPIGSVHGGCLFTIADVTCGAAASSHGCAITTVDGNLHYLRAAIDATCLYGEARELKYGKRLSVYEISITDQDGHLLTSGIFTFMSMGTSILSEDEIEE